MNYVHDRNEGWKVNNLPMTDVEVLGLVGTRETWSVTHHGGRVTLFTAVFTEHGWMGADDLEYQKQGTYPNPPTWETSLLAVQSNIRSMCRLGTDVEVIVDPKGEPVKFVALRFSSPGREPTVCPYVTVADEVWHKAVPYMRHRAYGQFGYSTYNAGILRHLGEKAALWMSDEMEENTSNASLRASLALLRHFGMSFPLSRFLWVAAGAESGFTVEMSVNHGPWRVVNSKGLPE